MVAVLLVAGVLVMISSFWSCEVHTHRLSAYTSFRGCVLEPERSIKKNGVSPEGDTPLALLLSENPGQLIGAELAAGSRLDPL